MIFLTCGSCNGMMYCISSVGIIFIGTVVVQLQYCSVLAVMVICIAMIFLVKAMLKNTNNYHSRTILIVLHKKYAFKSKQFKHKELISA